MTAAPNSLAHIAIHADDVETSRAFYEAVFGWTFQPWGPPGFYKIDMGRQPIHVLGALQQRRELVPGNRVHGFEPTIAVASIEATQAAILANGGRIVMERSTLPGVGELLFCADPAENYLGILQFAADPA